MKYIFYIGNKKFTVMTAINFMLLKKLVKYKRLGIFKLLRGKFIKKEFVTSLRRKVNSVSTLLLPRNSSRWYAEYFSHYLFCFFIIFLKIKLFYDALEMLR